MTHTRIVVPALAILLGAAGPGAARISAAPPPQYGQQQGWEVPPGEFNEIQRRGYRDGIEGAHRDFDNHRRPDVDNREAYRFAFRRGYETAASHLWGARPEVAAPEPPHGNWESWGMRGLENDSERRGFHEGMEEARKDFQSQRRIDPDDHEEFRRPPVPPDLADEFREGFMRGYEVATSQLSGEPQWQTSGDTRQWAPPSRFSETQRRGFQEGMEGARKDFGNHRRPNVANREEYREPRLPREFWHEYREGFRRGYEMAATRLWGGM
jgi:hypothetical protein